MTQTLGNKLEHLDTIVDRICLTETNWVQPFSIKTRSLDQTQSYGPNMRWIHDNVERKMIEVRSLLDRLIKSDEVLEIGSIFSPFRTWTPEEDFAFELKYYLPRLTAFERDYITIDESGINAEMAKLNKEIKTEREEISLLVNKINFILGEIYRMIEYEDDIQNKNQNKHFAIIRNVQRKIKHRCFFLRSENSRLIFNDEEKYGNEQYDRSNVHERLILEAYIKTHMPDNDERKKILEGLAARIFKITDAMCQGLEKVINKDIPAFDRGMYSRVNVSQDNNGRLSLHLIEQDGKAVDFNHTSMGRRWYFTYYFIKKCIKGGDILIIDEPAAFLHPTAQREILADLEELSKTCKVIISTHSPYMISDKIDSYYYVKMGNDGTVLNRHSIKKFEEVRNDLGLLNFNSIVLGEKRYILVEGVRDKAAIETFMHVFGADETKYAVFPCRGAGNANNIYNFIRTTALDHVLVLDADTEAEQEIDKNNLGKIVIVGRGTKELAIEGLFGVEDKDRYFEPVTDKKGIVKNKVSPSKLYGKRSEEDFTVETISNFKMLFEQLGIIVYRP